MCAPTKQMTFIFLVSPVCLRHKAHYSSQPAGWTQSLSKSSTETNQNANWDKRRERARSFTGHMLHTHTQNKHLLATCLPSLSQGLKQKKRKERKTEKYMPRPTWLGRRGVWCRRRPKEPWNYAALRRRGCWRGWGSSSRWRCVRWLGLRCRHWWERWGGLRRDGGACGRRLWGLRGAWAGAACWCGTRRYYGWLGARGRALPISCQWWCVPSTAGFHHFKEAARKRKCKYNQ